MLIILFLSVIALAGTFLFLQSEHAKERISDYIEQSFNNHFEGNISIGKLDGLLPFRFVLTDLELTYDDDNSEEVTLLRMDAITLNPNFWDLLFNRIRVNNVLMENPYLYLKVSNGSYTIQKAFKSRISDTNYSMSSFSRNGRDYDIFAPAFKIVAGRIYAEELLGVSENVKIPVPFSAYGIDLTMRLEISDDNKYLDIDTFTMDVPDMVASNIQVTGQIYNDKEHFEVNRLNLVTSQSSITLNSLITGVDLSQPAIIEQFETALYSTELLPSKVETREIADVLKGFPVFDSQVSLQGQARGYINDINFHDIRLDIGDSRLRFSGDLAGLLDGSLSYKVGVEDLNFSQKDIESFISKRLDLPFSDFDKMTFNGEVAGNMDTIGFDFNIKLPEGTIHLVAESDMKAPWKYSGIMSADSVNTQWLTTYDLAASRINMDAEFQGEGFQRENANFIVNVNIYDSYYDMHTIPFLVANFSYEDMILEQEFTFERGYTMVNGYGSVDFTQQEPLVSLSGEASLLNLAEYTDLVHVPTTSLNFLYDFNFRGTDMDRLYGRANLDINTSMVNGDILKPHQMYVDLDQPENLTRTLRFTSTFFDMFVEGDIHPSNLMNTAEYWLTYFQDRITEEFMFEPVLQESYEYEPPGYSQKLNVILEIKDLPLLRSYFPVMPAINSNGNVQFNVNADANSFLISGGWNDRYTEFNGYSFTEPDIRFTALFRHGERIRDFSSIDIDTRFREIALERLILDNFSMDISMREDSIHTTQSISNLQQDIHFNMESISILDSSSINTFIKDLRFGNPDYMWINSDEPRLIFGPDRSVGIANARFSNGEQMIDIQGVISSSLDDSVSYKLESLDLNRISKMINGQVSFQGKVDGEFFTKSLQLQPSFHGSVFVDQFSIDNRVIGDIDLVSDYDPNRRRFDTKLTIQTDTSKYSSYLAANNNIGNHIVLDGYFLTPNLDNPQETLYNFNVYLQEIDLWVIPYIATGIFEQVEGRGDGVGTISGNLEDFYFHANLFAHDAYVKPIFFNTDYIVTGHVELDRDRGVLLDTLTVYDLGRGNGRLYGQVEFNDFGPERGLNITLEANSLTLLNNTYEPEAYFYGNVGGTGIINISGTNRDPFVRTIEPVRTTNRSRLSIPLLDETRVGEHSRAIRFVDNFDEIDVIRNGSDANIVSRGPDRAFAEVFRLDLQFIASENNIIQLVFDPITGEVMNAEGSGRIRVTLEDEEFQIFGGFDIASGDYQFVGGDIFTRRFIIQDGGSIRWDGDPVNARLDITALYRSRPNINALLSRQQTSTDQVQRIPVDLMLDITGTIQNIENNFYFNFPNSVDATQNAAILALLNSEEQKLLQATSLLFTGGFIAVGSIGANQSQEFSSTMQSRTAQVGLSNLLSHQINTLLNSNLANLDIDFNLSGFDQADLGIALRLFDDRLVIRRDGQVAGAEADIGDVGAKYQISNSLAIELFHRKDPTLIVGTQGQLESINGVGLEAQMQFNTWKQFTQRIKNAVTGLFGRKDEED